MLFTLSIIAGLVLLYFGAEGLVRGSASAALRLGLTPLFVGLTVVAYGTSMPELIVSIDAGLSGQGGIAVGNVLGSNIFNVAVILGLAALARPLKIKYQLIRFDAPVMALACLLAIPVLRDMRVSRGEGALLLVAIIAYVIVNLVMAKKQANKEVVHEFEEHNPQKLKSPWMDAAFIVVGLLLLVAGSKSLLFGAVGLARQFGISEAVIGLTIVAAGTSLPELATSVIAAIRNEPDIAVGNVVGSSIYNILGILGTASLVVPLNATGIQWIDLYVMIGVAFLMLPMMWTRFTISRWEGALLLSCYGGYLFYLWPK